MILNADFVSFRNRLQKPLDSYQDEDLNTLREKWSDALMRRRQYLDQQIQNLLNKPSQCIYSYISLPLKAQLSCVCCTIALRVCSTGCLNSAT